MTKRKLTTEELLEKARQKREKRMGLEPEVKKEPKKMTKQNVQQEPEVQVLHKFIKTRKGYTIKIDCFENCENFAQTVAYTEEQRAAQNEAVEKNRNKTIAIAKE